MPNPGKKLEVRPSNEGAAVIASATSGGQGGVDPAGTGIGTRLPDGCGKALKGEVATLSHATRRQDESLNNNHALGMQVDEPRHLLEEL
jgi:hypothetical protein